MRLSIYRARGSVQLQLEERVRMYQNTGYLCEALSAGATELADDFAAHGQKRLTGHPACQLSFPTRSVRELQGNIGCTRALT